MSIFLFVFKTYHNFLMKLQPIDPELTFNQVPLTEKQLKGRERKVEGVGRTVAEVKYLRVQTEWQDEQREVAMNWEGK